MTDNPDIRTIVARLGGEISHGGTRALVPGPGHGRRDRSLSLREMPDGRIVWKSFAGDSGEVVWAHLGLDYTNKGQGNFRPSRPILRPERFAELQEQTRKIGFCRRVWDQTSTAANTPADVYLRVARNLPIVDVPSVLRFHPCAPMNYDGRVMAPALVAKITDHEGRSCGLHVTAIWPDGSGKANLANPRRMLGCPRGGAIQLHPSDGTTLAVAEGIETALAYQIQTGIPTWSALSANGLEAFQPPAGLKKLIIAADGDARGIKAAEALAHRLAGRCEVEIDRAPWGLDWADVVAGCGHEC